MRVFRPNPVPEITVYADPFICMYCCIWPLSGCSDIRIAPILGKPPILRSAPGDRPDPFEASVSRKHPRCLLTSGRCARNHHPIRLLSVNTFHPDQASTARDESCRIHEAIYAVDKFQMLEALKLPPSTPHLRYELQCHGGRAQPNPPPLGLVRSKLHREVTLESTLVLPIWTHWALRNRSCSPPTGIVLPSLPLAAVSVS